MKEIRNQTFDEERALYGQRDILVENCNFDGPADGESAFKEGKKLQVKDCFFNKEVRYERASIRLSFPVCGIAS